jgi:hypothetical protein
MGTVVVACRVQNGINIGDGVVLAGPTRSAPAMATGTGTPAAGTVETVGGFAFTTVDEQVWERWFKSHQDADMVQRGLVYAMPTMAAARQKARAQAGPRTFGTRAL